MGQGGADRRRRLGSLRRRPWRTLGVALLLGFVALNVLAYRHAGAMLTYHPGAPRPPSPESLTWSQKVQVLLSGVALPRPTNQRSPDEFRLKADTVAFRAADGTRLEAWLMRHAEPRGTVLVFHGYSASRASMLDEAAEFFRLGYHVLLVDFRGCGGSDGTTTTLGYLEAEDVVAAVEYVRQNGLPRPLVLYGQSMGAAAGNWFLLPIGALAGLVFAVRSVHRGRRL